MELEQYLDLFVEEAREHLQSLSENLLVLEENPADVDVLQQIFRSAHTLKGMAATMGFERMASLTHAMEDAFDRMRSGQMKPNSDHMDILFQALDVLEQYVASIIESGAEGSASREDIVPRLRALDGATAMGAVVKDEPARVEEKVLGGMQRVVVELDAYLVTVIDHARTDGFFAYQIDVELARDCLLRAARAYMVVQTCERLGDLVKAVPDVEQLEQERFESSFTLVLLSKVEAVVIHQAVAEISEVATVSVHELQLLDDRNVHAAGEAGAEAAAASAILTDRASPPAAESGEPVTGIPGTLSSAREGPAVQGAAETKRTTASKTIRVDVDRLDTLMNLLSELVIGRTRLESIAHSSGGFDLRDAVDHMERTTSELQNVVMKIRMVPVDTVFNRFPRMVRDLARDLGKQVQFIVSGGETELDRAIIDEIGDPIVHLLRNALDHGLESTEERIAAGKPEIGTLQLQAHRNAQQVFIEVAEDGRGIDRDRVLAKAVQQQLITAEEAMRLTDENVFELLFHSGFSTADTISDISGRGVGLDAVKSKLESIGGRVRVTSERGRGTRFSIELPLTLSIIDAMLVRVDDQMVAVPLGSIVETALIAHEDIQYIHKQPVIDFREKIAPLISLRDLFYDAGGTERLQDTREELKALVIRKGDRHAALIVEDFLGQQEIVQKPLGKYLEGVPMISGATILGDGHIALILDTGALIH